MSKNTYLVVVLIVLVLIVGICAGYGLSRDQDSYRWNSGMMRGGMMNRDGMMGNIDQHFIIQMIPHHGGAIAMAKVALQKSKRPEILSLANGIIEAQQREIDDMKKWYSEWYGQTVPIINQNSTEFSGMMHMKSMQGDLEKLKSSNDFDNEFVNQMIPHHEMAIMMASMLQNSTERGEMRILADQIITSQSREIDMMKSWQAGWNK